MSVMPIIPGKKFPVKAASKHGADMPMKIFACYTLIKY